MSSDFPFASKYLEVRGSKMHYLDEGEGDPILFLHGNPTSSYLWRNSIPHLTAHGRCIAPDLIGMGKSGKPDIDYTYDDHYAYLTEFIERLELKNITLVIHDWGSGLGFRYAHEHQGNVKGIAFMESMIKPLTWSTVPAGFGLAFRLIRTPVLGWLMVSVANLFLTKMMPGGIVRQLSATELAAYTAPYPTIASRKPILQFPREVPINGTPKHSHEVIQAYSEWLLKTDLPKLFFYATPGALIDATQAEWIKRNFKNLTAVDAGKGIHFLQEDTRT